MSRDDYTLIPGYSFPGTEGLSEKETFDVIRDVCSDKAIRPLEVFIYMLPNGRKLMVPKSKDLGVLELIEYKLNKSRSCGEGSIGEML